MERKRRQRGGRRGPLRNSYEQWKEAGSLDAAHRVNKLWKQMMNDYIAPPLDPGVDEAVRDFIDRRKRQLPDSFA